MPEPLTLAQAKAQCRVVNDTSEDALITSYIKAAREWVENDTEHILVRRNITEQRALFGPYIELHRRPVVSVGSITYTDTAGASQTYAGSVLQADRYPARVHPALNGSWPSIWNYGGVSIVYSVGYAVGEEPQELLQAMLLLIEHWYQHRGAASMDETYQVPFAVRALCDHYRPLGG